ncbi:efflux RND transporter periplasmic adaptor subunit [Pseudoteredinibacter isoporae]|uniref:Cu(I)/Ag(I) efflux system membrane fusion protein n=1 Tax=Pseudoteredinibacter isoporae TaxID=570281 RepID=A0A7X0MUD6_9GAMM|nr:efflux RND transporter periplasmic adaptor subunit [Pseudoteredinibacter isoporae]MBB6520501.1 Cu(I)/Ag(I) efflux system membrane fusion protein [Pseudoteredinibacter isoporae]NHO86068.1 efflux RND transporter periplasmic adaptor subunit [Pseudoteredinibacter isoporae]NIB25481.1 efflux RND transporter periplasmic adaptor subunit [Pseudoteredinibacter isoporae]
MNTTLLKALITLLLGAALGFGLSNFLSNSREPSTPDKGAMEKKPLYWVAPMDANYRRDKPGKSPMGMALIPVYDEENNSTDHGPEVVKIAPHIVNNLGIRTAQVESKALNNEISTVGYVQYDEDKLIHIHPRIDGWVENLYVKAAGNPVKKGQALYTLYSPELVNAQEELMIALKRNNNSLIKAARNRMKALHLSAEFIRELEKKREVQQTITFYSPQEGVVSDLKIREGFYVQPGNTLLSIAKLNQVWVEAEVFERDAALIHKGLPVTMSLDYLPGKTWQGTVDYVYPSLNNKTRTLRVRLKFDNPNLQLKPNMFAQIVIHAEKRENVILVPKESVIRTGKQDRVVLVFGKGQFKSVAVKIGRVTSDNIEILEGLKAGDTVVSSAHFLIDSESSKSSDFKRMDAEAESKYEQATVKGTINRIDLQGRVVNISREAIEKWSRPAAELDFLAEQSIHLESFKPGDTVIFTFEVREELTIVDISLSDKHEQHQHHIDKP